MNGKATLSPFERVTFDPDVMGGRACLRGLRITVSHVVGLVAEGASRDEILADFPFLEDEDIHQALEYAAWLAGERSSPPRRCVSPPTRTSRPQSSPGCATKATMYGMAPSRALRACPTAISSHWRPAALRDGPAIVLVEDSRHRVRSLPISGKGLPR